jgi:enediyne biosynthesis protein E4
MSMTRRSRTLWAAILVAMLPETGSAQFVNTTGAAGVTNPGQFSTNLAWGDYDGDGDVDLYVTNWGAAQQPPPDRLYRNELDSAGGVVFAEVSEDLGLTVASNSTAAAWVDYDSDGDLDLYVADFYLQDYLYQGDGGQSFTEVGRARGMVNLIKQGSVFAIGWGDYDNDGFLDLYLGKYYHDNELYHNAGNGLLEPVFDLGVGDKRDTNGLTWVDYDNDGDLDLYVVNREQENALYRNDLSSDEGVFSEIACALSVADAEIGQSSSWADYDNDGDLDLYVANVGANALYRNDGSDVFVNVAADAGADVVSSGWVTAMAAWADVNGDGFLDLYLANGADRQSQADVLAAGSATGTFADSTGTAELSLVNSYHMSAVFADVDTNGTPDLYVTDGAGGGNLLYQNTAPDSLFLRVVVRGRGPATGGANLFGYGSRVYLIDASTNDTVAYKQVLPPMAVPRTVTSPDGTTAGGSELIFGAPARAYNVSVRFPGNEQAQIGPNVRGGDIVVIDEPEP